MGTSVKGWKQGVSRGLLVALVWLVALPWARAETHEYVLDVPEGQPVTFILEFKPRFSGVLGIEAEWEGTRQLSFRVDGPGDRQVKGRRIGLSPQRFEIPIDGLRALVDADPSEVAQVVASPVDAPGASIPARSPAE